MTSGAARGLILDKLRSWSDRSLVCGTEARDTLLDLLGFFVAEGDDDA